MKIVVLLALPWALAAPARAQAIQFTEVSAASGLIWNQSDFNTGMGAGASLLDADGDGWLDVLLVGGKSAPGLFRNLANGSFADVTAGSGIVPPGAGQTHMGTACADVDSDFDVDVFLTAFGPNALYRNQGNATFTNVTIASGLAGAFWTAWGSCAAFGDYDQDGDLDLFQGNYVTIPSQPTPNRLYRNNGAGTFSDVTVATNMAGNGTALACMWSDYDQDGDVDLWLGNDLGQFFEPNRLYRNDGASPTPGIWTFTDVAPALGGASVLYCMGLHGGDFDRDLDFDYHFSNIGPKRMLRNDGPAGFADISQVAGLESAFDPYQPGGQTSSWGQGFHDFDQDGWLDLFVSHGYITPPAAVADAQNVQNAVNHLYRNDGAAGTFTSVGAVAGIEDTSIGRGAAFGDLDKDGDVDIVQANVNGPALLFRNDTNNGNRWLRVRPRGRLSAKDALGTLVRADAGGASLIREALRNYGYLASHDPAVHFGLGSATEVEALTLRWPRGIEQHRYHVAANQELTIKEPYLTFAASSTYTAAVAEGQVLTLAPVLQNHTAQAQTAYFYFVLHVGALTWLGPVLSLPLAAGGTASIPIAIPVAPGATGGVPVPIEIVWNLYDPTVGHDQWRNQIVITP